MSSDIDSLARKLDQHQANFASAVGKIRRDAAPSLVKDSARRDAKQAGLGLKTKAKSVVMEENGSPKTARLGAVAAAVVGLLLISTVMKKSKTTRRVKVSEPKKTTFRIKH